MRILQRFWRDERGSTISEYALIAGFVSVGLVLALTNIGVKIRNGITPVVTLGLN